MESTVKRPTTRLSGPFIAGAIVAGAGFCAVFFGLPLLGAVEHGSGMRIGIAVCVALFLGSMAAVIARGRSITALAEAALAEDVDPALTTHRSRRSRARWAGAGTAIIGFGATYAVLDHAFDADPSGLDLTLLTILVLGVGGIVWRVLDPGRFVEPEEALAPGASLNRNATDVSDRELARTATAVRAHQRRSRLAGVGSVFVAGLTMGVLGFGMATLELEGGRLWVLVFAVGVAAGVVFSRAVAPKIAVEDLDADARSVEVFPAGEGVTPLSFAQRLDGAQSLQLMRRSGWMRALAGGPSRSYHLSADDTALAEGGRVETPIDRLLPAIATPLRAEIRDGETAVCVEGRRFSARFRVSEDGVQIGTIVGAPFSQSYQVQAADEQLTLAGSFWNRRDFALLKDGARVGYIQIKPATGVFGALLSGNDVSLHLELPSDTSVAIRRVLLGALIVIDERHA